MTAAHTWVLLIIIFGYGGEVHTQEFNTKERCEVAQVHVIKELARSSYNGSAICVAK